MLSRIRHERILEQLHHHGPTEVGVLATLLHVSDATIRRDLVALEGTGHLTRVRGGAALTDAPEPPFAQVSDSDLDQKNTLAAKACTLVDDGDVVLLDIGTTTHRLAAALHGRPVTVVTSSLAVVEELERDSSVEVIVLGGALRRNYRSLVGFLTEQALRQIHVDLLFLGTSGVRADGGVLDTTMVEVPVKQGMIAAADRVALLADAHKFPGTGVARVCGPEAVDVLVTTQGADQDTLAVFGDARCEVHVAENNPARFTALEASR